MAPAQDLDIVERAITGAREGLRDMLANAMAGRRYDGDGIYIGKTILRSRLAVLAGMIVAHTYATGNHRYDIANAHNITDIEYLMNHERISAVALECFGLDIRRTLEQIMKLP